MFLCHCKHLNMFKFLQIWTDNLKSDKSDKALYEYLTKKKVKKKYNFGIRKYSILKVICLFIFIFYLIFKKQYIPVIDIFYLILIITLAMLSLK